MNMGTKQDAYKARLDKVSSAKGDDAPNVTEHLRCEAIAEKAEEDAAAAAAPPKGKTKATAPADA